MFWGYQVLHPRPEGVTITLPDSTHPVKQKANSHAFYPSAPVNSSPILKNVRNGL
jgi:hypothetical protein